MSLIISFGSNFSDNISDISDSNMSFEVNSSWDLSSTDSETCENGPCPASWSIALTRNISFSSTDSSRLLASRDARYIEPMECSNRV